MQNARRTHRKRRRKRNQRIKFIFSFLAVCTVLVVFFTCYKFMHLSLDDLQLPDRAGMNISGAVAGDSDEEDWCLVLVNKWNPMTTDGSEIETIKLSNGERVDKRIYERLQSMFDAARKDGVYPIVASGYRTKSEQEKLYYDKIDTYEAEGLSEAEAKEEAELWVAVPGTSEHQLGLAVDINADGIRSRGDEVYDWLSKNAYKYGFINRYPSDKTEVTGVANEPWHYRYVGVKAATEICSQGICLEEYLEK